MEIKRREFLKLFGGISGAALLGGCSLDDVMEVPEGLISRARTGPGIETWRNTICGLCPGGCGLRVRLIDDIPVYVKGNPIYPVNRGGMCPLGLNSLHSLYHPDRLQGPAQRMGTPGNGKWEPVSWEDALSKIARTLEDLRRNGKAHQVAFLGHQERGEMQRHIHRFMEAFGSPNYFQFSSAQNNGVPYFLLQGTRDIPAYDFLNAKLVVSFGANFLEEGYSPVYYNKLYSHHQETQTRYIHIDSRANLTASNADRWIPIRPGTYGALALGVAYVMIREELYDVEFVRAHTFGFQDWTDSAGRTHTGFRNMVLGNYYPERVSNITGIDTTTILELGREIGTVGPVVVLCDQGAVDNANGTWAVMAVHSLNALLGNFQSQGGVLFVDDPPFSALPPPQQDDAAAVGVRQEPISRSQDVKFPFAAFAIDSFTRNVLTDQPYPLSVLFIYGGNPLFQTVNQKDLDQALRKIPLIVSFDSIVNETSEYAHLILPDHNFLEKWDEVSNVPSIVFTHVGLQHPVIQPLYNTRHTGDVVIEFAKRLGGAVGKSFPFASYEEQLKSAAEGIYRSGRGAIVSEGSGELWVQFLERRGWQIGRYESFEEFWNLLTEQSGWWDPARHQRSWREIFKTRSGRFEFYSQELKAMLEDLADDGGRPPSSLNMEVVLNQLGISARGDSVYLPHHEPVAYEPEMPLYLLTFRVLPTRDGQGSALPMMQEMFGYAVHRYWQSWVEIHPSTAAALGITDGDWVWVESSHGSLKVRATLSPGIMPNVVAIPFGLGHKSFGRYARGRGVNPHSILHNSYDLISGKPALQATKVRLSLAS